MGHWCSSLGWTGNPYVVNLAQAWVWICPQVIFYIFPQSFFQLSYLLSTPLFQHTQKILQTRLCIDYSREQMFYYTTWTANYIWAQLWNAGIKQINTTVMKLITFENGRSHSLRSLGFAVCYGTVVTVLSVCFFL